MATEATSPSRQDAHIVSDPVDQFLCIDERLMRAFDDDNAEHKYHELTMSELLRQTFNPHAKFVAGTDADLYVRNVTMDDVRGWTPPADEPAGGFAFDARGTLRIRRSLLDKNMWRQQETHCQDGATGYYQSRKRSRHGSELSVSTVTDWLQTACTRAGVSNSIRVLSVDMDLIRFDTCSRADLARVLQLDEMFVFTWTPTYTNSSWNVCADLVDAIITYSDA